MALKQLGTNANNSLSAFVVGTNDVISADVATLMTQLRRDPPGYNSQAQVGTLSTFRPTVNQAYVRKGTLFIPNRGTLQLLDGDYICWDATTGWPLVISADAAAHGPYTHT